MVVVVRVASVVHVSSGPRRLPAGLDSDPPVAASRQSHSRCTFRFDVEFVVLYS